VFRRCKEKDIKNSAKGRQDLHRYFYREEENGKETRLCECLATERGEGLCLVHAKGRREKGRNIRLCRRKKRDEADVPFDREKGREGSR